MFLHQVFDVLQLGLEDSVADHARRPGLIIIILVYDANLGKDLRAMFGKMPRAAVSSMTNATLPWLSHSSDRTYLVIVILLFRWRTVPQAAFLFMAPHSYVVRKWLLAVRTLVSLHSIVDSFMVPQDLTT